MITTKQVNIRLTPEFLEKIRENYEIFKSKNNIEITNSEYIRYLIRLGMTEIEKN